MRVVGSDFEGGFHEGSVVTQPADVPQAVRLGNELVLVFENPRGLGVVRYAP